MLNYILLNNIIFIYIVKVFWDFDRAFPLPLTESASHHNLFGMLPVQPSELRSLLHCSPDRFRLQCLGLLLGGLALLVFPFLLSLLPTHAVSVAENACQPFRQVNEDAFGLGGGEDGTFLNEEGFEVEVFQGQLYLGMEADNSLGVRLWRSRAGVYAPNSQADWEEVAADSQGYPFGNPNLEQDDHVDSLAEFDGFLYVSTANRGLTQWGSNLYRSPSGDPNSWQNVLEELGAGFGNAANVNFKDMIRFQGYLCGGTQNWMDGAQVWCSQDGLKWVQKNRSGFGEHHPNPSNSGIWSSMVFRNALYFGVRNNGLSFVDPSDDVGKLFRTLKLDGNPSWEEIFSSQAAPQNRVDLLGELDGYLYIATRSPQGVIVYRSPSGDSGSWQAVSLPGINGNPNNLQVHVDGAVVYDRRLYVAVSNMTSGLQLWRTQGALQQTQLVDWERIGGDGLGDADNVRAELAVFNYHLYAWVTNYHSGQKVLRSHCFACADGQNECDIWIPDLPFKDYFPLINR